MIPSMLASRIMPATAKAWAFNDAQCYENVADDPGLTVGFCTPKTYGKRR